MEFLVSFAAVVWSIMERAPSFTNIKRWWERERIARQDQTRAAKETKEFWEQDLQVK